MYVLKYTGNQLNSHIYTQSTCSHMQIHNYSNTWYIQKDTQRHAYTTHEHTHFHEHRYTWLHAHANHLRRFASLLKIFPALLLTSLRISGIYGRKQGDVIYSFLYESRKALLAFPHLLGVSYLPVQTSAVRKGLPPQHCVVSHNTSPPGFVRLALSPAKTHAHWFEALKMKPLGPGVSEH